MTSSPSRRDDRLNQSVLTASASIASNLFSDGLLMIGAYQQDRDWMHSARACKRWYLAAIQQQHSRRIHLQPNVAAGLVVAASRNNNNSASHSTLPSLLSRHLTHIGGAAAAAERMGEDEDSAATSILESSASTDVTSSNIQLDELQNIFSYYPALESCTIGLREPTKSITQRIRSVLTPASSSTWTTTSKPKGISHSSLATLRVDLRRVSSAIIDSFFAMLPQLSSSLSHLSLDYTATTAPSPASLVVLSSLHSLRLLTLRDRDSISTSVEVDASIDRWIAMCDLLSHEDCRIALALRHSQDFEFYIARLLYRHIQLPRVSKVDMSQSRILQGQLHRFLRVTPNLTKLAPMRFTHIDFATVAKFTHLRELTVNARPLNADDEAMTDAIAACAALTHLSLRHWRPTTMQQWKRIFIGPTTFIAPSLSATTSSPAASPRLTPQVSVSQQLTERSLTHLTFVQKQPSDLLVLLAPSASANLLHLDLQGTELDPSSLELLIDQFIRLIHLTIGENTFATNQKGAAAAEPAGVVPPAAAAAAPSVQIDFDSLYHRFSSSSVLPYLESFHLEYHSILSASVRKFYYDSKTKWRYLGYRNKAARGLSFISSNRHLDLTRDKR